MSQIRTASPPVPPDGHHPILALPFRYQVRDFTDGDDPLKYEYSVGKYDEDRRGMYTQTLFSHESAQARTVHMGVDIGAPVGTPVFAFKEGLLFDQKYLPTAGDYGFTMITQHVWRGAPLWALYGHLSSRSLNHLKRGDRIERGHSLGWLGDHHENGGWPPHLHFQLSLSEPKECDLPGVVMRSDRIAARRLYPDPRLILGALYE